MKLYQKFLIIDIQWLSVFILFLLANIVIATQDITKPTNLKKAERDICLSSSGVRKEEKILRKFGNAIVTYSLRFFGYFVVILSKSEYHPGAVAQKIQTTLIGSKS